MPLDNEKHCKKCSNILIVWSYVISYGKEEVNRKRRGKR
jgi:hypothetical protein